MNPADLPDSIPAILQPPDGAVLLSYTDGSVFRIERDGCVSKVGPKAGMNRLASSPLPTLSSPVPPRD